jgi:cytoskeleton protein RodZ
MEEVEFDLKSLRESRGLTLKDIFERTRISVINLEAIEKEDFHVLPPPVFTKAFIKTYAKTLGVDSGKMLGRYEQYLETLKAPSQKGEINTSPQTAGKKFTHMLWSLSILTGVGIIAFSVSLYKSDVDIPKSQIIQPIYPALEVKPPDAAGLAAGTKSGSADSVNAQQSATVQNVKKQDMTTGEAYRLTIEAKELTWIRITTGQNTSEEILLKPGERIERSALNFVIDIGNAGGIQVDFQGKPLENLGKRGQVVHLKLP